MRVFQPATFDDQRLPWKSKMKIMFWFSRELRQGITSTWSFTYQNLEDMQAVKVRLKKESPGRFMRETEWKRSEHWSQPLNQACNPTHVFSCFKWVVYKPVRIQFVGHFGLINLIRSCSVRRTLTASYTISSVAHVSIYIIDIDIYAFTAHKHV